MGRLSKSQGKLGQCIAGLGGTVVTKATEEVDICISKKGKIPHVFQKLRANLTVMCCCKCVSRCGVFIRSCKGIYRIAGNFGEH